MKHMHAKLKIAVLKHDLAHEVLIGVFVDSTPYQIANINVG